jgi:hypothetical protein
MSSRHNQLRERVAQLAAQLMAEHGIQDFGLAKRKAARQMGVEDGYNLPGNQEIELALKSYQALYHSDSHPARLRLLREIALDTMRTLSDYHPYLTGSVLNGTAGPHSDINLQLFTDNEKEFELYLMQRNIPFKQGQRPVHRQGGVKNIPSFTLNLDSADVEIAIYPEDELRSVPRGQGDGRTPKRAKLAQVQALLDNSTPVLPAVE